MLLLETSLTSNNIEEVKNYLYDTPTFQRQSINFCMKNVVNDCNFPSYMQSTVLNFFMLNKNFVFVTSSTFETSLVPIQFSDVYVIQLLRIALLLVSDTS